MGPVRRRGCSRSVQDLPLDYIFLAIARGWFWALEGPVLARHCHLRLPSVLKLASGSPVSLITVAFGRGILVSASINVGMVPVIGASRSGALSTSYNLFDVHQWHGLRASIGWRCARGRILGH